MRLRAPLERLQLVDQVLDDRQPALPEGGVARIEAEGLEQLGVMLGSAGREHFEIARRKSLFGAFVNRVQRIHEAIAERVGVDVERRMDEMRDVGPEGLVARLELDPGT